MHSKGPLGLIVRVLRHPPPVPGFASGCVYKIYRGCKASDPNEHESVSFFHVCRVSSPVSISPALRKRKFIFFSPSMFLLRRRGFPLVFCAHWCWALVPRRRWRSLCECFARLRPSRFEAPSAPTSPPFSLGAWAILWGNDLPSLPPHHVCYFLLGSWRDHFSAGVPRRQCSSPPTFFQSSGPRLTTTGFLTDPPPA